MIPRNQDIGLTARPYKFKGRDRYMTQFGKDKLHELKDPFVTARLASVGLYPDPSPRSVYKVEKLFDALAHYSEFPEVPQDKHFVRGVRFAKRIFGCPSDTKKLSPWPFIGLPKAVKSSTSAGLTAYGRKKEEVMELGLDKMSDILLSIRAPEPCLAFARTQKNDKTRLVWGYPLTMTLMEAIFARPLINYFKIVRSPMHFAEKAGVTSSKLRARERDSIYAISLDYSQFDASISAPFIYAAFKILRSWFDLSQNYAYVSQGEEVGVTLQHIWNIIVRYFVNSPIVMPDGLMYVGRRGGVPSGSYFTQIVDSVVNTILIGMLSSKFQLHISAKDFLVLGDDGLIYLSRYPEPHRFARFLKGYGFTLNSDKCEVSTAEAVRFLGRRWVHGEPEECLQQLVNKICYPERFRQYSSDPYQREREVDLLLRSYAVQYMNFSGVFLSCVLSKTPVNFEAVQNMLRDDSVDTRLLSGYQKYRLDYLDSGVSGSLGTSIWR